MRFTHLILKLEDLDKALNQKEAYVLSEILEKYERYRLVQKKIPTPEYIVINADEPYIQEIIDILKKYNHWEDE